MASTLPRLSQLSPPTSALNDAFPYSYSAAYAARGMVVDGAMYRELFGQFDAGHAGSIVQQYETMIGSDWGFSFGCGAPDIPDGSGGLTPACDSNTIAVQIDWGAWDQVYACDLFFASSRPNVDLTSQSRAEVVIHELSHTRAPWRTEDINDLSQCGGTCYGHDAAISLAMDPTCWGTDVSMCKAVRNAENVSFFATHALMVTSAIAAM